MTLKLNRLAALAALLLALVCASGCETILDALDFAEGRNQVDPAVAATYFDGPKVRPGVALSISVTAVGQPNREAKQYFVDAEGCITMELVGTLKCDGLTLIELQQKVVEAYKEYYLDPSVTAVFVYQAGQNMVSPWGTVKVLGEVGKPGPVDVPSTMDLTVLRALQLAGGVTSIADKRRVLVTRCDKNGKQTRTRVDLVEIGERGRPDLDMVLKAGDVVWVPMSWY